MDQLAAFEQKIAKGLSYRECLQIQMDILENSSKYVESLELHLKEDTLKNCDERDILDGETEDTEGEQSEDIKKEIIQEETIKIENIMEENIKKENISQEDINEENYEAVNIKIKNIIPNYESRDVQCSICHSMLKSKQTVKVRTLLLLLLSTCNVSMLRFTVRCTTLA